MRGVPVDKLPTTCGFCSCGCVLYIEPRKGRAMSLCPSANHPVSTARLCFKGWNATPSVLGSDRLQTPLIRKGDHLEPATWQEAISFAADAIRRISSDTGPESIGIIGSAKTTNEECYGLVKLARAVIGTPNIDGSCRFYDASIIPGLIETTGTPASQLDLNSLAGAGSMLIVGANVMEQLPHVGSRIIDAVEKGCKVVAVDPRDSIPASQVGLFLHPMPGTDIVWLRALIATIINRKLYANHAVELPGFEELCTSIAGASGERLKEVCGIDSSEIAEAAEMLASGTPPVVMFGLGALQQANSTRIVKALADVAILMGGLIVPLRGQNNAQGACDLGLARELLPGYGMLTDPDVRKVWESAWNCKLPSEPGMSAVEMLQACNSGKLKALMVFGENVALSAPNTDATLDALDKVDFLAVADMYLTETAEKADVVFPACSFLEKDGTFTNIERRVQRVRKIFEPIGESKSDLAIIADLASALGKSISSEPAKVMAEIAVNVRQYAGVSYKALDESWGVQWPLDLNEAKLDPILAVEVKPDEDYPFKLIASRAIFPQQTGTMSSRYPILTREYPEATVELNEGDAEKLGLKPGRLVTVTSKSGSLTRMMSLGESAPPGCVHVPHYFGGDSPNRLIPYDCDPISGVPAYKTCAVKIEAAK